MKGIAQIVFQDGGLICPSNTPYEREILFEHVAQYAKRYGRILVRVDRGEWTVALADEHSDVCAACRERPDKLTYTCGGRTLCHPCASRRLR